MSKLAKSNPLWAFLLIFLHSDESRISRQVVLRAGQSKKLHEIQDMLQELSNKDLQELAATGCE